MNSKTMSKAVQNSVQETGNRQNKPPSRPKKSVKKTCLIFLAKAGFTATCLLAAYLVYLDSRIRNKMDGQIWRLPAEVYSKIESIRVSDGLSREQVKQILRENEYRQTTMVANPGDFKEEENTIVLIRRAFPFPHQPENQRVLRLRFTDNKLVVIEDLVARRRIDDFRMAPKLIAMLQSENEERLAIPLQHYPRLLIDTLILTEDRRFYQHSGVSLLSIARAMYTNFKAGHTVQGGSTLTQQLVKNLFLSNERSLTRKINEALMALLLDRRYDKNRILETYLNEIYLGQNGDTQIHGFELASQFFFGRPAREISLDQMALLVGMVKGPSLYNPWRNPNNALERRNVVLRLMLEHQMIDRELYHILSKRPLGVQEKGKITRSYPAFIQTVQSELRHHLGENKTGSLLGARIFTTLDMKQQFHAEQSVIHATGGLQIKMKNPNLQSAMIIANYHTGEVQAIVGGTQTDYAGFNRALNAKRQIGSLVKPSIYLTALTEPERFRLNTPVQNRPVTIYIKGSAPWQPRNYDRKYSGPVMLVDALARSLNIPTVNIGRAIGLNKVIETQKAMGWDKVSIPKVPATLLGSYSISPYDVTRLYQTIANQGARIPLSTIRSVIDRQGNLLYEHSAKAQQVVPAEAAFQTLYAMQQVVERGTARSLMNNADFANLHLAGKTGTTNDSRDTWYVGIDGENVVTTWLGRDDNSDTGLTGSSGALQVYKDYLTRAAPKALKPAKPDDIKWVGINSYGSWDCDNWRRIPVWANRNQSFCSPKPKAVITEAEPASLWDVLKPSPSIQAPPGNTPAPIEDAAPAE